MAGSKGTSKAAQAQALDQVSSPESTNEQFELSNADIVASFKPLRYEASSDEVSIISQGNDYTSGKRADDGKTFTRLRLVTDDEDVLEIIENISEFDGGASFLICEQERPKEVALLEADEFDKVILTIGLRLADPEDENSDILNNVNLVKVVGVRAASLKDELAAKRDKLAAERARYQAQKRFYSSSKMDDLLSQNLLAELQNA